MEDTSFEQEVADRLAAETAIMEVCDRPPRTCLMPYMKSATDQYIVVVLCLKRERISVGGIHAVGLTVVRLLRDTGALANLKGAEVLFSVLVDDRRTDRIMRLAVHDRGLPVVTSLSPSDLLQLHPVDGVTCGWYWDVAEVPT